MLNRRIIARGIIGAGKLLPGRIQLAVAAAAVGVFGAIYYAMYRAAEHATGAPYKGNAPDDNEEASTIDETDSTTTEAAVEEESAAQPPKGSEVSEKEENAAPTLETEPDDKKDDLSKIKGVGPKTVEILERAGICRFTQLAGMDLETLKGVLNDAGVRANPSTWPEQARALTNLQ